MRNIGIPVKPPLRTCDDPNCPFHGTLSIRGEILTGAVVSTRAKGMVVIERTLIKQVKKYKRYMRVRRKLHAKLPKCLDVQVGDEVRVAECRPLSKTISFVIIEKLGGK